MNRRIQILLVTVVVVLAALSVLALYLTGGIAGSEGSSGASDGRSSAKTGLVHVRSIYMADGENLRRPVGIGADDQGRFFVTLKDDARVIGFDRSGDHLVSWGKRGVGQGEMLAPLSVAVDRLAGQVYVIDRARLRIISFDTEGKFQWERPVLNPIGITNFREGLLVTTFGPLVTLSTEGEPLKEVGGRGFAPGQFDYPRSAVELSSGDVVVADSNNTRVQRVKVEGDATATVVWVKGEPPRFQDDPKTAFGVPSGVTVDDQGRIFVLDGFRHDIHVLDPKTGEILHTFDDLEGDADGRFQLPTGIVHLHDDYFAVTDTYNDRVQIIRLLLPEENTFIARNRWAWWLSPLALLPLLLLFRRRRVFATQEALGRLAEDERLRLLPAIFGKVRVLPDAAAQYGDVMEAGVRLGDHLRVVGSADEAKDSLERLSDASKMPIYRRLLLARDFVVCVDEEQCEQWSRISRVRHRTVDSIEHEYRIVDEELPPRG